jgi:hypothetical protein
MRLGWLSVDVDLPACACLLGRGSCLEQTRDVEPHVKPDLDHEIAEFRLQVAD